MTLQQQPILSLNAFDSATDDVPADADGQLLARRAANAGAASVLFYRSPLHIVRAQGVWMYDVSGRPYLDLYNNVPSVGHCHPRVIAAISGQAARLNISTRYLNTKIETYAERLKATLPDALSNLVMVCSGSEANDLALRLAVKASGGTGFIVTEAAYHGNTASVTAVSPSVLKQGGLPSHVRAVKPPGYVHYGDDIAGGFAAAVAQAADSLAAAGVNLAGLICDSIFSSDGVYADPAGFLQPAVEQVRSRGGLYIADEVQPGFGRTGDTLWGFQRHALTPDIVTMGKPMGNGFPMAGVATRPDLLAAFCADVGYFNTFGGNPVAAAAGLAVLDVIDDEGLLDNARHVGDYLLMRLHKLAANEAAGKISEVRGAGLYIGIELSLEGDPQRPDPDTAVQLINFLRERRILIGAAGRYGNTLKIRPPLCLQKRHAKRLIDAMAAFFAER